MQKNGMGCKKGGTHVSLHTSVVLHLKQAAKDRYTPTASLIFHEQNGGRTEWNAQGGTGEKKWNGVEKWITFLILQISEL